MKTNWISAGISSLSYENVCRGIFSARENALASWNRTFEGGWRSREKCNKNKKRLLFSTKEFIISGWNYLMIVLCNNCVEISMSENDEKLAAVEKLKKFSFLLQPVEASTSWEIVHISTHFSLLEMATEIYHFYANLFMLSSFAPRIIFVVFLYVSHSNWIFPARRFY